VKDNKEAPSEIITAHPHLVPNTLFLIVVVALVLRLAAVAFLFQQQLNPRRDHWPFGYETGRIARSIASGQGFSNPLFGNTAPTAWMTPVYPYLLAGVFKLFGIYSKSSAVVILSLNSLFSALTCLPVFFIARKSFGDRVAGRAGLTWAFFPYAIYLSADWIWESSLTTLLLSLLFLISLRLERSTRLAAWVGFGLLWGLAALTSPVVLSVLPFLGGWVCYRLYRQGQRWGLPAAAAGLSLVAVVTPWFVRNYRTFHEFIPFRDSFGLMLYLGNSGDTSHWAPDWVNPSTSDIELEELNRLGELSYVTHKQRQACAFIRSHPGWFAWVTLRRIVYTWTGFWSFQHSYLAAEPFDPPNILLRTTLTVLALAGLRRAMHLSIALALPYLLVLLTFPLAYYVTIPEMHYRHPIDPQIVVLAVHGLTFKRVPVLRPATH
jgi:4-amino-4-deoxy-L-arabinose transferase-like glycosyltransferase